MNKAAKYKDLLAKNWDRVLEYTKDGCADCVCSGCPFGNDPGNSCVLIHHSGKSNTAIENEIRDICTKFVSEHLYGILSDDK